MADFCFVHAADLHLDAPFTGMRRTDGRVGEKLREASLDALDNLVELCLTRGAAFLVLAGDVYDGPVNGLRAQLRLRDGLARLSDAGIWTFIAHGNHDPLESGWSAVPGGLPERVAVFPPGEVAAHEVRAGGGGELLAVVHGVSYPRRDVTENLALRFRRGEEDCFQVAVLHCNVQDSRGDEHAAYSPCGLGDLLRAGFDYWALGHVHTRQILSGRPHGGESWVAYPGNLQSRSPRPSELGAKGALVVEVERGRVAEADFVACDTVRFEALAVDLSGATKLPAVGAGAGGAPSLSEVRDLLFDAASDALGAAEGRSLVLRATLTGRTGLAPVLRRPGALDELLASLRDGAGATAPFVWWDDVADATRPELDHDRLAEGGDFVADVVQLARAAARRDASAPLGEIHAAMSGSLQAALRQRVEQLLEDDPSLWAKVLDSALTEAVDALGLEEVAP